MLFWVQYLNKSMSRISFQNPVLPLLSLHLLCVQVTECAEYRERIYYELIFILDGINSTTTVNSSVCVTPPFSVCSVVLNISLEEMTITGRNFTLSIQAVNSLGSSNVATFSGILTDGKLMTSTEICSLL